MGAMIDLLVVLLSGAIGALLPEDVAGLVADIKSKANSRVPRASTPAAGGADLLVPDKGNRDDLL